MKTISKRSLQVAAPLVASVATALLTGCHQPEMQRCVDEQNRVVAQNLCQGPQQRGTGLGNGYGGGYGGGFGGGLGYIPMYRYYYGGGGGWNMGEPVSGGSYNSVSGHTYTTSSSSAHATSAAGRITSGSGTSRGGFGSSHGGGSRSSSGGE